MIYLIQVRYEKERSKLVTVCKSPKALYMNELRKDLLMI